MTLYGFADIINKSIIITRYANQSGRFSAYFEGGEIKSGGCLIGIYGNGATPQEALNNYKNKIVGQNLVFNARSNDNRQEYVVPKMDDV